MILAYFVGASLTIAVPCPRFFGCVWDSELPKIQNNKSSRNNSDKYMKHVLYIGVKSLVS